jgi:hypothetical protein
MDELLTPTAAAETPAPYVYKIPAHRLSLFQEKFAKLERRAKKLGCPVPTFTVGELAAEKRVEEDLDGERFITFVEYYPVTVDGAAPRYNGWSFLAVVDYEASAPMFRKTPTADAHEIPERYRTMGPRCEHCRLDRGRKETFIVRHEDGRVMQVGRQCIRDFLGHDTPENIASMAAFEAEVRNACHDEDGGGMLLGGGPMVPEIGTYLAWVVRSIRLWGWLSRSAASEISRASTASDAAFALEKHVKACREGRGDRAQKPTDADKARAEEVLAWAKAIGDGEDRRLSDYEHNLKTVATLGRVTSKHFGLVASAVAAFDREAARRRAVKQEHVGTVNERLRGVRVFVDRVYALDMDSFGRSIVTMRDGEGHVFKWVTNVIPDTGREYTMTATVKEHGEWKGTLQTVVTRAELQADDEPTKAERRNGEILSATLSMVIDRLTWQPLGWTGRKPLADRRYEAEQTCNLVELEAVRGELYELVAVIEPTEEPADDHARLHLTTVRSYLRAKLAAFDPSRKVRKLKPAERAVAAQMVEAVRTASNAVQTWPLSDRAADVLLLAAEAQEDDLAALRGLLVDMRTYVGGVTQVHNRTEEYLAEGERLRAQALAALDAEPVVVPGASPVVAARVAKALREAMRATWPFAWSDDEQPAFLARVDSAEKTGDVATLETLRTNLIAMVPSFALKTSYAKDTEAWVAARRDAVLVALKPAAKAKKAIAAPAAETA